MERVHRSGLEIIQQAEALGYETIIVDDTMDPDRLFALATAHLRLQ